MIQMMPQPTTPTTPTVPLPMPARSGQGTPPPSAPIAATSPSPEPEECRFLALIMPSDEGERQSQAMENWFQACSTDEPFSLELVGTKREQGFLLRASSEEQLTLLCKQLEAQYPQAEIQRVVLTADPLILHTGEHAVIGEFALAQPSYLPLKTFSGKALAEPGADPLAGLLASMEAIGSGQRIIAQLALARAPETWLSADIRKSVEHALQPERDKVAASMKNTMVRSDVAEGSKLVVLLAASIGGIFAYRWYRDPFTNTLMQIRPDAELIYLIKDQTIPHSVLVEYDRATTGVREYEAKYQSYTDYLEATHLALPPILVVTQNEQAAALIRTCINTVGSHLPVVIVLEDQIQRQGLLTMLTLLDNPQ